MDVNEYSSTPLSLDHTDHRLKFFLSITRTKLNEIPNMSLFVLLKRLSFWTTNDTDTVLESHFAPDIGASDVFVSG